MDICIDEFDTDLLISKKNCLILGNHNSGKSFLIKDIINSISPPYNYGVVITNKFHIHNFYNKFFDPQCIYKRYSSLHNSRLFIDNMYLILDNYTHKIDSIMDKCINKHMLLFITSLVFLNLDLDFIFLLNTTSSNIQNIYTRYIPSQISLETFNTIIDECTKDYGILVINCSYTNLNNLFMSFIAA